MGPEELDFTAYDEMMEKFNQVDATLVVDMSAYKTGSEFSVKVPSGGQVVLMFTSEQDDIFVRET